VLQKIHTPLTGRPRNRGIGSEFEAFSYLQLPIESGEIPTPMDWAAAARAFALLHSLLNAAERTATGACEVTTARQRRCFTESLHCLK
jgi:hypothetical protein